MKILFAILSIIYCGVAISQEAIDYYAMSDSFAECAALNNTLAMFEAKSESEYLNHYLHQVANGSIVVATDFAIAGGYKKDLVASQYDGHFSRYQSLLKTSIDAGDIAPFIESIKGATEKCKELNEIQTELIKEKRKQIYKAK